MSTICQPVLADVADLFTWKTSQTLTSITTGASGQSAFDNVKVLNDSFFCFVAYRGWTNYDGAISMRATIGAPAGAAATAIYPAIVDNNFEAMVKVNNDRQLMDKPCPQAVLCSTGYRAGNQIPVPILFPPLTQFNFEIYATAPVLFTLVDGSTQINLRVEFGLFGYNVRTEKLDAFLQAWPALYGKAIDRLTSLNTAPGL